MALLIQFNIFVLLCHNPPQSINVPIILFETTQGGVHVQAYITALILAVMFAVLLRTLALLMLTTSMLESNIAIVPLSNQQYNVLKYFSYVKLSMKAMSHVRIIYI